MKRIFIAFSLIAVSMTAHAQNARQDASGNYVAIKHESDTTAMPTGKIYTDLKGNSYPVMMTKAGKLFVIRTSAKTGKKYKQYLKLQ